MLPYYISQSNDYAFRTQDTASAEFTMSLQDMYQLNNLTASISGATFTPYENIFSASIIIPSASVGYEYRAQLFSSGSTDAIWHGTFQVYASQSIDKAIYETKNDGYISHNSDNEYIILD